MQEDRAFKNYVANCLRLITENTAKTAAGFLGEKADVKYITVPFDDILRPKKKETRTDAEIIHGIKKKLKEIGGEFE